VPYSSFWRIILSEKRDSQVKVDSGRKGGGPGREGLTAQKEAIFTWNGTVDSSVFASARRGISLRPRGGKKGGGLASRGEGSEITSDFFIGNENWEKSRFRPLTYLIF